MIKRGVIAAVALLSALSLLQGCGSGSADRRVDLHNEDDSLSFAVSMLIAKDMPLQMEKLGVDSDNIVHFVRGLCDAFPVDESSEAKAYANGVLVAASAMEMLSLADAELAERLANYKENLKKKIEKANEELRELQYEYKTN